MGAWEASTAATPAINLVQGGGCVAQLSRERGGAAGAEMRVRWRQWSAQLRTCRACRCAGPLVRAVAARGLRRPSAPCRYGCAEPLGCTNLSARVR